MTAGVLRRFLAGTLDALPGAAMALLLAKLGLVPGRVLSPETGWFWSDWLVKA